MTTVMIRTRDGEVSIHKVDFEATEPLKCGLNLGKGNIAYITSKMPKMLTNEKVCPVCFPDGELPDGF